MRRRLQRFRTTLLVLVGMGCAVLGITAYTLDLFRRSELDTVDARFSIRGDKSTPHDLVVVAIDDKSFNELNLRQPFPRSIHGQVIRHISQDGPKAIAYDIQFSEPTVLQGAVRGARAHGQLLEEIGVEEDEALARAVQGTHGRMVLATTGAPVFGFDEGELHKVLGARAGNANVPNDPGRVIRRFPFEVNGMKSFGVATVEVATGRHLPGSDFGGDTAWIDYRGRPGTIKTVSFSDVKRGELPHGFFRGKIVVVGPTASTFQDLHPTSVSGEDTMSGAEIQANAISTIARDFPLDGSPEIVDLMLIVLFAAIPPLAILRLRDRWALVLTVGVGVLYVVATQFAFDSGLILSFVYPFGTLVLSAVGTLAVHAVTAVFEREHVHDVFSRFVPEQVVDEALDCADDDLRLPPVRRQCTVMFADLRGFTTFAEALRPEHVVEVLNRYLSEMSGAILDNGGTLISYMGDGIMAVFGAPIEQTDHADRSLAAAREMLWRLERFNQWIRSEGLGDGFRMGIGINSGTVMSGNIGSERRMEYTAIGDTTNAAARLEAMTKETPYQVLVSDSTRAMLRGDALDLTYLDAVPVRGKVVKANLWALAPQPSSSRSEHRTVSVN